MAEPELPAISMRLTNIPYRGLAPQNLTVADERKPDPVVAAYPIQFDSTAGS